MYINLSDLKIYIPERILIQVSNNDNRAITINEEAVNQTILEASELIDGFLHGRYELPLSPVPTMVTRLCKDISRYFLYQNRPDGQDLPKAVTQAYDNSMKILKEIQNGTLHLGIQETQALQPESGEFRTRAKSKLDLDGY